MLRYIFLFFLYVCCNTAHGQCIVPQFTVKPAACLNETLEFVNSTAGAYDFQWDFCAGDLESDPLADNVLSSPDFFRARSIQLIEENDNWYGFSISATANVLMRLDFGNDPGSAPVLINLGNVGSALSSAFAFETYRENGIWHLLVANGGGKNILRYSFLNGVSQTPVATVLTTPSVFDNAGPTSVEVHLDGTDVVALVSVGTNVATSKIIRLNFGSSIVNDAPGLSEFILGGANQLRGMAFVKECDEWFGFAISFATNSIYRLSFGSSLMNAPVSTILNPGISLNQPVNIEVRNENAAYYAFIQNARTEEQSAGIYRVDFGSSIANTTVTSKRLTFPQLTGGGYALDVVTADSRWYAYTFNLTTQSLVRISFANICAATSPTLETESVLNAYSSSGLYSVVLQATDEMGNTLYSKQAVTVSEDVVPDIGISFQNICAQHNVGFGLFDESDEIINYVWDFGDGNTSSSPSPQHVYVTGSIYYPTLTITSLNGCQNFTRDTLKIYAPPSPGFTLPPGLVCTNTTITFSNTTIDSYDGNLLYEWRVQDTPVSDTRDLQYSFTTTGDQTIKLVTSIPGCSTEISHILPAVHAGPLIDFSVEGQCATEEVSFTTEVSETVTDHVWSFDDGTSSTEVNPSHQFDFSGTYQVSLTATSLNGCNNSSTQEVTIFSKPTPDFSIQLPPLSCSGVATPFSDLTPDPLDSDILTWLWQFGESTQTPSTQDAEFIFANAGDYDVSLTVMSDAGCEASVSKVLTIYPSPVAVISQTPACLGTPTTFTAVGDEIQSYYWEIGTAYYENSEIAHTFQNAGDHPLMLEVYGENNCLTTLNQIVNVPHTLTPNFSFINQCVGYETKFTDITEDEQDPIALREWNFSGVPGVSATSPTHVFNSVGEHNVRLTVATGSGCTYAVEKTINVLAPPVASFTASPETGAAPLDVQFANTSTNASEWLWTFNDQTGNTSMDHSPNHTFTEVGEYNVDLLARNSAGCEIHFEKIFTVVTPLPDVNLKLISTSENPDGSIRVIITLENKGNTFIKNLPVAIDISGSASLTETVEGPIPPGSLYNLVLSYSINRVNNLSFLCADVSLENDLAPGGNRMCIQFDHSVFVFHPYPNPATDNVTFEWLSPAASEITIQLADSFGKTMLYQKVGATIGLNRHQIDVSGLKPGIYFIILKEREIMKTYRIVVSGQN